MELIVVAAAIGLLFAIAWPIVKIWLPSRRRREQEPVTDTEPVPPPEPEDPMPGSRERRRRQGMP